jgi:hypothetical protein
MIKLEISCFGILTAMDDAGDCAEGIPVRQRPILRRHCQWEDLIET